MTTLVRGRLSRFAWQMPIRAVLLAVAVGSLLLAFLMPASETIRIEGRAGQVVVQEIEAVPPTVPGNLEIHPVVDLSASYADDLTSATRLLPQVAERLASRTSLRMGLSSFIDEPERGEPADYAYREDLPLTDDPQRPLADALSRLEVGDGGDVPEPSLNAVLQAARGADWRPDATHLVVLMTDAPSSPGGPSVTEVAAALQAQDVRVVAVVPDRDDAPEAAQLAELTGGSVQRTDSSSSDLDEALLDGVGSLPVDVVPTLDDECPVDNVAFSPSRVDDAPGGTPISFRLALQIPPGTRPGEHRCTAHFGDGSSRPLTISVTS